ncbi:hypothetical protein KMB27_20435 [Streptomyces sp. COG19]|uniref:hypothetical protein n=1 Tax=Streptomyces sp. COG19 TaxID=2838870 RepID=UPI001BEC01AA|nr:hypothetical protein [Streptomyces sp. COG19]MBT3105015.1 hypothetical protein [Streptomyces sp. COG19]
MEEVEDVLVTCMWRLVAEARRSKQLLDNELLLHFRWTDMSWLGALEVSQDLADDLDLAYREALALSTAVTAVEEASTDFRGADLQSVDLDGVDLEGIRWDSDQLAPRVEGTYLEGITGRRHGTRGADRRRGTPRQHHPGGYLSSGRQRLDEALLMNAHRLRAAQRSGKVPRASIPAIRGSSSA